MKQYILTFILAAFATIATAQEYPLPSTRIYGNLAVNDSLSVNSPGGAYQFDVQGGSRITNQDSTLAFIVDTASTIIGGPLGGFYAAEGSSLVFSGVLIDGLVGTFAPTQLVIDSVGTRSIFMSNGEIKLTNELSGAFSHDFTIDSSGFGLSAYSEVADKLVFIENTNDSTIAISAAKTEVAGYFSAINAGADVIIRTSPISVELGTIIGGDTSAVSLTQGEASIYGITTTTLGQTGGNTRIRGQLIYVDGNQGEGKVLQSDASGNASWVKASDLDFSTVPAYADNAAAFAALGAGKLYYTDVAGEHILKISH